MEDPDGFVFNVPSNCQWDVLVEIPDRRAHLDEPSQEALSHDEGMCEELPVLTCVGQPHHPIPEFDLEPDTRLVCKYLKAFKDGTIDELYSGQGAAGSKVLHKPEGKLE